MKINADCRYTKLRPVLRERISPHPMRDSPYFIGLPKHAFVPSRTDGEKCGQMEKGGKECGLYRALHGG